MGTKISELTAANAAAINADPTYFCVIVDGANRKVALTELVASLGLGTAAALDTGTTANKVVKLDGSAKLPAVDGSQLTSIPYSGLTGKPTLGTAAALDTGTTANKVVKLDGDGKLPAVDGSQLTNLPGGGGYDQSLNIGDDVEFGNVKSGSLDVGGGVGARTFNIDAGTPNVYQSFGVSNDEVLAIGCEGSTKRCLVYFDSEYHLYIDNAGKTCVSALSIEGVDMPAPPTTDGDYKLVVASGVASWVEIT